MPFPNSDRPVDILDGNVAGVLETDVDSIATLSLTIEETQMPPGSANGSSRAAMLTPSP
jgi:hypothetical protein